jgi:hypothetical protein
MSIGLKGNVDGSGAIQVGGSDAITISTGLVVTGSAGNLMLQSGTAVASTSGTSIDFTGIPSWAKRITVMFNGVSVSGTSNLLIQIGLTTPATSGYLGLGMTTGASSSTGVNFTTGFGIVLGAAANVAHGVMTINLIDAPTFKYVAAFAGGLSNAANSLTSGGSVTLSGILDRVRITTVNGTDTFDAGTVNILWE